MTLRMVDTARFSRLREFLAGSGWTEEFLLAHFQIPGMHLLLSPFGMHGSYLALKYRGEGLPLFLARTLIGGFPVAPAEAARYLPADVIESLIASGILESNEAGDLQSTVLLYPYDQFFVAGDRVLRPSGFVYREPDFVMTGMENLSRRYVEGFGKSPCGAFLEIGTGAGLGALVASRFARKVTATDITPRAIHFARFNAALNGVGNIEFLEGDLFAPVAGRRFDRIVSHPPFEPELRGGFVFSSGGSDGEQILERLVREGPEHLERGGRLYYQVTATDRVEEPFEARVRQWLGSHSEEMDAALFIRMSCAPREYAIEQLMAENADSWKLIEWNLMYARLRATLVLIGYLVLQKRAADRAVFSTRRVFGPETGPAQMEWLVDWETRAHEPGFAERLLASRPVPGQGWQLHVRHGMRDGKLATLSSTFFSRFPFETNLHCAPWIPVLVNGCDGVRTGRQLLTEMQKRVPITEGEFVEAVTALAGMDVLRAVLD